MSAVTLFVFLFSFAVILLCALCATIALHVGYRQGSTGAIAFNEAIYRKRMECETAEFDRRQRNEQAAFQAKVRTSLDYERMSAAIKNGNPPSQEELDKLGSLGQSHDQKSKIIMMPCQEPPINPA